MILQRSNNMKYDVFISYSRANLEVVKSIKAEIEMTTGVKCWMDLEGIESGVPRFTKSIIDGIKQCQIFLFMCSAQSQSSEFALRELNFADKRCPHIVIVHIDTIKMNEEFEFLYGLTDAIDWNNLPQREKLLRDIKKWISDISKLIGRDATENDEYKQFHIDDIVLGVTRKGDLKGVDYDDYKGCEIGFQNDIVSRFCALSDTESASILFSIIWGEQVDDPSLFSYNFIWNSLKEKGFVIEEIPKIEVSSQLLTSEISFEACLSKTTASYICKFKFYKSHIGFIHNRFMHKSLDEMLDSKGTFSEIEITKKIT